MVHGIEKFKEWFSGYESHYAIIGGTACDLLMSEEGLEFRGTKDIDLVLIVEVITPDFCRHFWRFIHDAGYEHQCKSNGQPQFYRFSHPASGEYPFMIELFSRKADAIVLPEEAVLTPLPMDEEISSLSAIMLDDNYYQFLKRSTVIVDGISVPNAACLIPFKAKAWLDLTERKANGESVDSKSIRKHRNDAFRLSALLVPGVQTAISKSVWDDLKSFLNEIQMESVEPKQLGLNRKKEQIIQAIAESYYVEQEDRQEV